jgi:hypothetical protein
VSQYAGLRRPRYFIRKEEKEAKKLEPQVFKPIYRRPFMPQTQVKMLNSVFGRNPDGSSYECVAGEEVYIDQDQADEFILKGYADGQLSRNFSDDEVAQIKSNVQYIQQQASGDGSANG